MQNGGESLDAQGKMMWHCNETEAPTACWTTIQSRVQQVALYRMSKRAQHNHPTSSSEIGWLRYKRDVSKVIVLLWSRIMTAHQRDDDKLYFVKENAWAQATSDWRSQSTSDVVCETLWWTLAVQHQVANLDSVILRMNSSFQQLLWENDSSTWIWLPWCTVNVDLVCWSQRVLIWLWPCRFT